MTLTNDLAVRVKAVRDLEDSCALWRDLVQRAADKHRSVLVNAYQARKAGVLIRDIVEITGISRSSLYAFFAQQEGFPPDEGTDA